MKKTLLILFTAFIASLSNDITGQTTTKYDSPYSVYYHAEELFEKAQFSAAREEFNNFIDGTLMHLEPFFPNAEFAISGSSTDTKASLHIILQNYVIHNETEKDQLKHIVKYIYENHDKDFDWKVYTKNRNMKCINQSKGC